MPLTKTEIDHYKRLVDKTIVRLCVCEDEELGTIPGFILDDGTQVLILRDPEGNGPGYLEIEPK